jgi:hypothetical protein
MRRQLFIAVAAAVFLGVAAGMATASEILVGNTGNSSAMPNLGNFQAVLTYMDTSAASASLRIDLTNTSPPANGGFITAFVFNNPGNQISTISQGTPFGANFSVIGSATVPQTVNGAPFGHFDFGASTGGSFEGGGNPARGFGVGATESFVFNFTGTGLNNLNENSFINTLSGGTGAGQGDQSFAVRFRGFLNGGSDKVPGMRQGPEPASLVLFGFTFAGAGAYGLIRRRKSANQAV